MAKRNDRCECEFTIARLFAEHLHDPFKMLSGSLIKIKNVVEVWHHPHLRDIQVAQSFAHRRMLKNSLLNHVVIRDHYGPDPLASWWYPKVGPCRAIGPGPL